MRLVGLILLVVLSLVGCGADAPSPARPEAVGGGVMMEPPMAQAISKSPGALEDESTGRSEPGDITKAEMAATPVAIPGQAPSPSSPPPHGGSAPLLIYSADYTISVVEVTKSLDKVLALAKDLGGYLVRRDDHAITVRVPAEKYRGALQEIAGLGKVVHQQESVEDVTDQFHDMQTRLENARAVRARLRELLAASRSVTESLAVERELARVSESIDLMESKLKRLRELIDFSTITVACSPLSPEQVASNVTLPFPWLDHLGLGQLLRLQ